MNQLNSKNNNRIISESNQSSTITGKIPTKPTPPLTLVSKPEITEIVKVFNLKKTSRTIRQIYIVVYKMLN
jgi:hypothetical protein